MSLCNSVYYFRILPPKVPAAGTILSYGELA